MLRPITALALAIIATTATAQDKQPLSIEAVTFNIRYLNKDEEPTNHWRNRKQLVIDAIKKFDADIYGIQESLREQLDDIADGVPGYTEFGIGRDDGKTRGEYSPILFRTDRFTLDKEDSGTFWLSDTPEKIASKTWGNKIPRICTWARLTDTRSKRSFYVFNTHWDHQSQESRLAAAKLITGRIAKRKHRNEPIILMGDFNAASDNPAIQHLATHLKDSLAIAHPTAGDTRTFHGFHGGTNGHKIDHIFVPANTTVTAAEVLRFKRGDRYPSDHYPVRAALQFR